MATIYEGTARNQQQVDERIDPEILRALGLGDVSDLDYGEYKTLLKERLAANRMNTNQKAREDSAELDEKILKEFKRVKTETGRFRVKNERVSYQKMISGNQQQNSGRGAIVRNVTFQQQQQPTQEEEEEGTQKQGLNEFLTNVVAPSLSKIEASLGGILENLTGQQKAEEKASSKARVQGEKAKKRAKENRFEGLGNMGKKVADIAKKVFSPLAEIFGMIFKFLSNVFTGFLAVKLLEYIQNPDKLFRDIGNAIISIFNVALKLITDILYFPVNALIDGLNSGLGSFEDAINNTIGKIPGIPRLDLPEIPKPPTPQIPYIPPPKEEKESSKAPDTKPSVPAMFNGGSVKTDTGQKVSGAGPDTQLVALQPGEFVMSKGAVGAFGVDTMMNMNAIGGGTNSPKMAKVQSASGGGTVLAMQGGGSVVEHLHGEPGRQGYRSDHGTESQAHDHYAFSSEDLRKYVQSRLASGQGPSGRKYQIGSTTGGKHATNSFHYAGQAFDIPWSQFGSGKITNKDFAQSRTLDKDVRALVAQFNGNTTPVQPTQTVDGKPTQTQIASGGKASYTAASTIPKVVQGDKAFQVEVTRLSKKYNVPEDYMYAVMSFETGGSFSPGQKNQAGSGATGLIQFMPSTAEGLGTTTEELSKMNRAQQMKFVEKHFDMFLKPGGQGYSMSDLYMSILYPAAVGKDEDYVMFKKGTIQYTQNSGLDKNNDGVVTKAEAAAKASGHLPGGGMVNAPGGQTVQTLPQQPSQGGKAPGSVDLPDNYEKPAYLAGVPMVTPGRFDFEAMGNKGSKPNMSSPPKPIPPRPPSRGGSSNTIVPVLSGGGQQPSTSASSGDGGSTAPMFSPLDMSNPELIVVKSIYNIVG